MTCSFKLGVYVVRRIPRTKHQDKAVSKPRGRLAQHPSKVHGLLRVPGIRLYKNESVKPFFVDMGKVSKEAPLL